MRRIAFGLIGALTGIGLSLEIGVTPVVAAPAPSYTLSGKVVGLEASSGFCLVNLNVSWAHATLYTTTTSAKATTLYTSGVNSNISGNYYSVTAKSTGKTTIVDRVPPGYSYVMHVALFDGLGNYLGTTNGYGTDYMTCT